MGTENDKRAQSRAEVKAAVAEGRRQAALARQAVKDMGKALGVTK